MATYTVDERGRDGEAGRPYTFGGTLEVVHTRDGGARPEHVLVYRRDDGRRVVEFRTQGPLQGGAGDGYAVVVARGPAARDRRGLRRAAGPRRDPPARVRDRRRPAPLTAARGWGGTLPSRCLPAAGR